jgi:hypothetical protein
MQITLTNEELNTVVTRYVQSLLGTNPNLEYTVEIVGSRGEHTAIVNATLKTSKPTEPLKRGVGRPKATEGQPVEKPEPTNVDTAIEQLEEEGEETEPTKEEEEVPTAQPKQEETEQPPVKKSLFKTLSK